MLNAAEVAELIHNLASAIENDPDLATTPPGELVLIGIRRRGEIVASRVAAILSQSTGRTFPVGKLDITMYRDDVMGSRPITIPIGTEMNFRIDDRAVVLFDDVLHTGRSVRAALDALVDFGRPRFIRLAVLIDREGREYPIRADFAGKRVQVPRQSLVRVHLSPTDIQDGVFVDHPAVQTRTQTASAQGGPP